MQHITINEIFLSRETIAATLFEENTYPWEILPLIKDFILQTGPTLPADEYDNPKEGVWIAKDAKVAETVLIGGPCIIDHEAEVRHCAYIRGSAIIGKGCTVGNSTELKNVILFDKVQAPHYNYVGDSILGYHAHMGAGSITSNVKSDKKNVVIKYNGEEMPTNRKKVGAMIGDYVELGCNCVLNPGTIVGPYSQVYPLSSVRGVILANNIYKTASELALKLEQFKGNDR